MTCSGTHEPFPLPEEQGTRFGVDAPIDVAPVAELLGAAFDGCTPCQSAGLDLLQNDPLVVVRCVELAAMTVAAVFGGLPSSMTDPDAAAELSREFRRVAAAGADRPAEDHREMYALVAGFDTPTRRQVLDDAIDMIIGYLGMPADITVVTVTDPDPS